MTSKLLLATLAVATTLIGAAALAGSGQVQAAGMRVNRDNCLVDAQRAHADRGAAQAGSDSRCHERRNDAGKRHRVQADAVMHVVPNRSQPDDPSYGWQYYSDPRVVRAVVISPAGEYFLSRGDGPRQITGPAGQVLIR